MFPPRPVSGWAAWKRESTGVNIARRLWEQRQRLRREYVAVHGTDPGGWPTRHPGVVLDEVLWMAHPACLRCTWFDERGIYMKNDGSREEAVERARGHEDSFGAKA